MAARTNADDSLCITLRVANQNIECGKRMPIEPGKGLMVDRFSFYLSNLKYFSKGLMIHQVASPLLIHACERPQKLAIPSQCDSISLTLGIDSVIQEQGPLAGHLDPIHGFYWTWQSGYIHIKFEGKTISENAPSERPFTLHLGGYRGAQNCVITRGFRRKPGCNTLGIHLDELLESEVFLNKPLVMSPGPQARKMALIIADSIKLEP